jgi:high-affinity K+ transport system ATPase subunit B
MEFDLMNTATVPAPAINLIRRRELFSSHIVLTALKQSVVMLRPDVQWKNPVMFVVEIGAALTLLYIVQMALGLSSSVASIGYFIALDVWLWLTVLFANFATAIAEERGPATKLSSKRAKSFPATATSSKAARSSTRRRSPANPLR